MKKAKIIGASLAVLLAAGYATGQYVVKPKLESKIRPLVEQKLNTAINGTIEHDPIHLGWTGVYADNVQVKNRQNKTVLKADKVKVGLSPIGILEVGLKKAEPLRALGTITINKPKVYVNKNLDGKWNIADLLKKKKNSTPMSYRGYIVIKDGVINASNGKLKQSVDTINGVIKCTNYPNIKGAITFNSNDDHVTTTFNYDKNTSDWSVYLGSKSFNISNIKALMPEKVAVENLQGAIKDTNITITSTHGKYKVDGTSKIVGLALKYDDYEIKDGNISLLGEDKKISIPKAAIKINDQLLTLSGDIDLKNKKQNIKAYLVKANLTKLANKKNLKGQIDASANVTGKWNYPVAKGSLKSKNIEFNDKKITDAELAFNYVDGVIDIDKAKVKSPDGDINAKGWYNSKNKKYQFEVDTKNFALDTVYKPLQTKLTGVLTIKGQDKKISKLETSFKGYDFTYKGNYLGTLTGKVTGANDKYLINDLEIATTTGSVKAIGVYENSNLDIQVKGKNVSLEPLARFIKQKGEGLVDFTAHITDKLTSPQITGEFASNGGVVRRLAFDGASGNFTYKDKRINIENGLVVAGRGSCLVKGEIGLSKDAPLEFDLKADNLRAENVSRVIFDDLPATGNLSGDVKILGSINNIDVRGDLQLKDASVLGEIVTKAKGKFTYRNKVLKVDKVTANIYDAKVTGSGEMVNKDLNFKFAGENMELARLISLPTYEVSGKVKAKGFIKGSLNAPVFTGDASSKKILVNGVAIENVHGALYCDPKVISINNAEFDQGLGHYLYNGGLKRKTDELFGYAKVKDAPVSAMLKVVNAPVYNLDGALSGDVDLGGTLKQPMVKVVGKVNDTIIKDKNMGVSDINLKLERGRFEIKKFKMPIGNGFIAAAGEAEINGDANIQVAANEAPIDYLASLTGSNLPVEGTVAGVINLTGKTNDPKMQMSISVNDVDYNDVKLDRVFMLATLKSGVLDINQILAEHGKYKVKLYGKLPLVALSSSENIPKSVDNRMDVNIDITEADLGVLPLFTSYVTTGQGDVTGKVHITGPIDDMDVYGQIDLEKGSLNILSVDDTLQNIKASVKFDGQKAVVDVGGDVGKGYIGVKGDASWGLKKPLDYKLHLLSKDVVIKSKFFEGPLRADFTLEKQNNLPLIKGKLDLSNDTINIPLEFANSNSDFNPQLDISIVADEAVRLYNPILYDIPVVGDISFKGTKKAPIGSGMVHTKMGTIKYLNNRFQIKEAKAKFNRLNTFLPNIDVKADTMVTDYIVKMNLKGPVEHMGLKLSSEPNLTEEQILSLLTVRSTNFDTSQLQENAMNTIVSTGLQMVVFGSVENAVQSKLGIDRFAITNNYLDPYKLRENTSNNNTNATPFTYYSLELGKTLFPKFVLTYGMGLNYDLNRFGFNYKIGQHLGTEAWFTNDDNYYYGLKYKVQF